MRPPALVESRTDHQGKLQGACHPGESMILWKIVGLLASGVVLVVATSTRMG
jgi:hypothetical protein